MTYEGRRRSALRPFVGRRGIRVRVEREDEEIGALAVRCVADLGPLVSEILSDTRSWAVVGLTSRHGEERPAISPTAVRAITGPQVPIYLISWQVTIPLQRLLPNDLHVFGGAGRVWWPLPRPGRDPASHPLVYDASGEYGRAALADLARAYESTRPPSRTAEEMLLRERNSAEARARRLAKQVERVTRERDQLLHRNARDGGE